MLNYPWLRSQAALIKGLAQAKQLPHAILINSLPYLGGELLAQDIIDYLLCLVPNSQGSPCHTCDSCLLNDNHPDLFNLIKSVDNNSSANSSLVSINEVRLAINFISLSKHVAKYKIVYIQNINALNNNASNALLKSLEEPEQNTIFILVTQNISGILSTIKSRCQIYNIPPISYSQAINHLDRDKYTSKYVDFWLKYYANAPFFEVPISDDNLDLLLNTLLHPTIANIYQLSTVFDGKKITFGFFIDFMLFWLAELIKHDYKLNELLIDSYTKDINKLLPLMSKDKLFYLMDKVLFFSPWKQHPLNYKLQIENLLFQYQQVFN